MVHIYIWMIKDDKSAPKFNHSDSKLYCCFTPFALPVEDHLRFRGRHERSTEPPLLLRAVTGFRNCSPQWFLSQNGYGLCSYVLKLISGIASVPQRRHECNCLHAQRARNTDSRNIDDSKLSR